MSNGWIRDLRFNIRLHQKLISVFIIVWNSLKKITYKKLKALDHTHSDCMRQLIRVTTITGPSLKKNAIYFKVVIGNFSKKREEVVIGSTHSLSIKCLSLYVEFKFCIFICLHFYSNFIFLKFWENDLFASVCGVVGGSII